MGNKVETILILDTPQKTYNIINDKCPICEEKFGFLTNVYKKDGKGYHLSCYLRLIQ